LDADSGRILGNIFQGSLFKGVEDIKKVGDIIKKKNLGYQVSYYYIIFESTSHMGSFCKEHNKLVGASNYLAWKKIIDLILTEQDVMQYVAGEIIEPSKDKAQELAKYKKGEVRAQRIIVESIKDSLVPFVANLKTSKAMYDKLVNLYFVSTTRQNMSLWNKLYKMKKIKG